MVCGYIYNEEQGMPEDGIPPGTAWNDVPEDWAVSLSISCRKQGFNL